MNARLARTAPGLLILTALAGCAAQVAHFNREAAEARGAPERCFGVARAGKNDCRTQAHVCAGWARREGDTSAFVYLPAGTCERIVGGSLEEGAG